MNGFVLCRAKMSFRGPWHTYLKRDGTGVVLVEDLEHTLGEEWLDEEALQADGGKVIHRYGIDSIDTFISCWKRLDRDVCVLTFLEVTIFLNSSRRISFSLPTVLMNSCSSRSRDDLSKPVLGLPGGKSQEKKNSEMDRLCVKAINVISCFRKKCTV